MRLITVMAVSRVSRKSQVNEWVRIYTYILYIHVLDASIFYVRMAGWMKSSYGKWKDGWQGVMEG